MGVVDEIKQRLDIVDVVSEYVRLEKSGRNFRALCPFHSEKTPSFFVSPERQSWRCFGCGAGGDVFSFVKRKEGVDFGEALRILAQKAGVTLARRERKETESEEIEKLRKINEAAAAYYHYLLLNAKPAQGARLHLEGRGIWEKTIEEFQLGYSLDSWDGAKQYLMAMGFSEEELITSGLLIASERGSYDRFRGRLMFPIRDGRGRVLGFGARALPLPREGEGGDPMPKYINSPQTPIFDKGSILYGIDRARDAIREQQRVVIVEGYMDAIMAHQHGIRNVVATMGTALTEKQIATIKGLTKSLILALDSDAAGDAATWRGIEILRQALDRELWEMPNWLGATSRLGAEIKVIAMPQGKDPDDVIRESPEEWQRLLEGALPVMDYLFAAASRLDLTQAKARAQASEQLLPLIGEIGDELEREIYLGKLAQLLGVSERTLANRAARLHRTKSERVKGEKPLRFSPPSGDPLEEYCLCLLLRYPELRGRTAKLSPEYFQRSENQELFIAWRDNPQAIEQGLDANLHQHLSALSNKPLPREVEDMESAREKALADCIRRLEQRQLRAQEEFMTLDLNPEVIEVNIKLVDSWR
jgi:DNA primase